MNATTTICRVIRSPVFRGSTRYVQRYWQRVDASRPARERTIETTIIRTFYTAIFSRPDAPFVCKFARRNLRTRVAAAAAVSLSRCRPKHAFRFLPTHNDADVQYTCARVTRRAGRRRYCLRNNNAQHSYVTCTPPSCARSWSTSRTCTRQRVKVDPNVRVIGGLSSDICRPRQNYYRPVFYPPPPHTTRLTASPI